MFVKSILFFLIFKKKILMGKWNMKSKATSQRCERRTAAVSSF